MLFLKIEDIFLVERVSVPTYIEKKKRNKETYRYKTNTSNNPHHYNRMN